jgi:hypothetical protein
MSSCRSLGTGPTFPSGFNMPNGKFSGDDKEITLTVDVQNGRPLGDYTITVLGQAQVPFNKDSTAKERPNTLVSLPGRPITLRVVAAAPKEDGK